MLLDCPLKNIALIVLLESSNFDTMKQKIEEKLFLFVDPIHKSDIYITLLSNCTFQIPRFKMLK